MGGAHQFIGTTKLLDVAGIGRPVGLAAVFAQGAFNEAQIQVALILQGLDCGAGLDAQVLEGLGQVLHLSTLGPEAGQFPCCPITGSPQVTGADLSFLEGQLHRPQADGQLAHLLIGLDLTLDLEGVKGLGYRRQPSLYFSQQPLSLLERGEHLHRHSAHCQGTAGTGRAKAVATKISTATRRRSLGRLSRAVEGLVERVERAHTLPIGPGAITLIRRLGEVLANQR